MVCPQPLLVGDYTWLSLYMQDFNLEYIINELSNAEKKL